MLLYLLVTLEFGGSYTALQREKKNLMEKAKEDVLQIIG